MILSDLGGVHHKRHTDPACHTAAFGRARDGISICIWSSFFVLGHVLTGLQEHCGRQREAMSDLEPTSLRLVCSVAAGG